MKKAPDTKLEESHNHRQKSNA